VVEFSLTTHDSHPPAETATVDSGLGEANQSAAPVHEVHRISCFAKSGSGSVIGGAVGRWWGECCELQQLWVAPSHRRQGIGAQLLLAFEAHANRNGCTFIYLESFNFQTPELYMAQGYHVEYVRRGYPYGILKYHMTKRLRGHEATGPGCTASPTAVADSRNRP
jgi:ribosomal protein S18 acetylase RimI-like enzyme